MSFRCRIGLHDWTYGEPYKYQINWLRGAKVWGYEIHMVQDRTCSRCNRTRRVKVGS